MPILVLLLFLLWTSVAQQYHRQNDPNAFIYNILSHNEQFLVKVLVEKGEEVIASRDYELLYSLEQSEIVDNITLSLDNLQHNITLSATLYKLNPFIEIAHTTRSTSLPT